MHIYNFYHTWTSVKQRDLYLYQDDAMIGNVNVHMHVPMLETIMSVMVHVFAIINYTVQGVEISHRAEVATVAGVQTFLQNVGYELDCNDSEISYLPLAHIFDR